MNTLSRDSRDRSMSFLASFGTVLALGAVLFSEPASAATTRTEDSSPTVVLAGVWLNASMATLSGGSAHEAYLPGSTASFAFMGTGVTWISYRCTCTAGISNVYIDGKFAATIDTYAPSPQAQAPVFSVSGLTPGPHDITIEVTGNYDPAGQTAWVVVDAFDVTS